MYVCTYLCVWNMKFPENRRGKFCLSHFIVPVLLNQHKLRRCRYYHQLANQMHLLLPLRVCKVMAQ